MVEECVDDVWPWSNHRYSNTVLEYLWSNLLAGWRDPSTSKRERQYPLPTQPALSALIDELYNSASCISHLSRCLAVSDKSG